MKFNLFAWSEIPNGEAFEIESGVLHVMCSEVAKVWVSAHGYEVLAGVGHEVKISVAETLEVRIEAPKGAKSFVYGPRRETFEPRNGVFTNMDKRPVESETVLAVKRALREMQLQQAAFRAENRKMLAKSKPNDKVEPEPKPEPEPEPEPATTGDPEPTT